MGDERSGEAISQGQERRHERFERVVLKVLKYLLNRAMPHQHEWKDDPLSADKTTGRLIDLQVDIEDLLLGEYGDADS